MAKTYTCPLGRRADYPHPAPERTAYRVAATLGTDDFYRVWPNRESMARTIRMQQQREARRDDWRPMVPLSTTEGF